MNTLADRIDLRQLAERLRKGKVYIIVCIFAGLLWTICLNSLSEKKILYQKEMFYKVGIAEEICPLRKKDIEYCIYGEDRGIQLRKQKISHRDLEEKVILLITEPMDINKQIESFKIFIQDETKSNTKTISDNTEKRLYGEITQKVLSVSAKNSKYISREIDILRQSRDRVDDILKSLQSKFTKLQRYNQLISEGKISVLEKVSQTQPEVIWQMPNILSDLPSALIIGLALGIILALLYVKR